MRYMGAPLADCVVFPLGVQKEMVTAAATYSDDCAKQMVEVANATPLGKRENMTRIAASAGLGLLVGALVAYVVAHRRGWARSHRAYSLGQQHAAIPRKRTKSGRVSAAYRRHVGG